MTPTTLFGKKQQDDEETEGDEGEDEEEETNPYSSTKQPNKYHAWRRAHIRQQQAQQPSAPTQYRPPIGATMPRGRPTQVQPQQEREPVDVISSADIPDDAQIIITVGQLREIVATAIDRASEDA